MLNLYLMLVGIGAIIEDSDRKPLLSNKRSRVGDARAPRKKNASKLLPDGNPCLELNDRP